jgi:hypothetical protein
MTTHDEQTNSASTSTADAAPTRRESSGTGSIYHTNRTNGRGRQSFFGDHEDRRATHSRRIAGHGRRIVDTPHRTD